MWEIFLQGHILKAWLEMLLRTIELSPKPWKHWWIDHGTTKVDNACSRIAILFLCNSCSYCRPPCKSLHVGVLLKASLSFKHLALPVSFFENIEQWFVQFWFLHHMLSSVMTQDSKTLPKYIIQNNVMGGEHVKPTTLAMTVEIASNQCMWSFTNTTQLVSVTAKRIPTSVFSTKVTNKPWSCMHSQRPLTTEEL